MKEVKNCAGRLNTQVVMDQFIRDDLLKEEGRDFIVSSECNNEDGEERRFVLDVKGLKSSCDQPHDRSSSSGSGTTQTKSDASFAKHQVNYSATKYIKP